MWVLMAFLKKSWFLLSLTRKMIFWEVSDTAVPVLPCKADGFRRSRKPTKHQALYRSWAHSNSTGNTGGAVIFWEVRKGSSFDLYKPWVGGPAALLYQGQRTLRWIFPTQTLWVWAEQRDQEQKDAWSTSFPHQWSKHFDHWIMLN